MKICGRDGLQLAPYKAGRDLVWEFVKMYKLLIEQWHRIRMSHGPSLHLIKKHCQVTYISSMLINLLANTIISGSM